MAQLNVTINGKVYRMACADGEENHLSGLADQLNQTIDGLRGSFGEIGDQRLTVMAAITLADDLHETKRQLGLLTDEVATLREAASGAAEQRGSADAELAGAVEAAADQIERLARKIAKPSRPEG